MCTYIQIVKEQKQMILPSQPKTRCRLTPCNLGGGERVRTDDLLRARQALSQLSYTPNSITNLRLKISDFNYLKIPISKI